MTLEQLNALATEDAKNWLVSACTASKWCALMAAHRPYNDASHLLEQASQYWQQMEKSDVLEALAGHPMIGDLSSLRAKYAHTKAQASGEQSGMQAANDQMLLRMQQLNQDYLHKHGFIFIMAMFPLTVVECETACFH
jgi:2-oxo-4-hydroxy-4-carboxy-5-ureidoimidazoline decarboxylase